MRRTVVLSGLLALLVGLFPAATVQAAPNNNNSPKLRSAVTVQGIREHLQAFQAIADANGDTRLAGTPGHELSAEYVAERARAAGYNVTIQEFEYLLVGDGSPPVLDRITAPAESFVDGVDFMSMNYSGSGDVTADVWAVDLLIPSPSDSASTSGCEENDFLGMPAGAIALIQRGTCTFGAKADNAVAAGAVGVIIFNEGTPSRLGVIDGTLNLPLRSIPVVGTTFAVGDNLRNGVLHGSTGVQARLRVDSVAETRTTQNVIAETPEGAADNVVVVGAHLDSVSRGPGINDNGSGSATLLEVAEEMAKVKVRNQVRFIWFSAEESGLLGSAHYVNSLTPAERGNIALMLNFDMVGSPNFVRFVYDGDTSHTTPPAGGAPTASAEIEDVFLDYFAAQGLATEPTAFDGRSDYGPFIAVGIPAGGLFTGAEGIKSPAQAAVYGGTAGAPYDPCYHLACDTMANVSDTALDQMSDAVAHAVITFAQSTSLVNGRKGKGNFRTADAVNLQADR
ncbi:MAG TPA: M28 family metallopeptidase [Actinomycetota bacterium]|nr:M28 family metallopeptidase [Actinomycetota bacterium]